ncbi:MAG TPA: hypothetical protein VFM25_13685 [Verrucomicrobiae bacterium]|nr:hypothetical protein [Verrucomicrobiae bacterium]
MKSQTLNWRSIIPAMTVFKSGYSVDRELVRISGSTPAPGVPGRASRPAVARETATHVRTIHALDVFRGGAENGARGGRAPQN